MLALVILIIAITFLLIRYDYLILSNAQEKFVKIRARTYDYHPFPMFFPADSLKIIVSAIYNESM